MFTASGSKRETQDIKSLILFLRNCGPLNMDLGVGTTEPEVTERKLLSLYSTISNTDLIIRDLGVCTLKTGWKPLLWKEFDLKEPSDWERAPENVAPARNTNFEKKAKLQGKERTILSEALATASYNALDISNQVSACFNALYFHLASTPAMTNLCSSATWQGAWAQLPCPSWVRLAVVV